MNTILLIVQREYWTRVRKKSFVVMTLLGPLLVAIFYGFLIWVSMAEETPTYRVLVLDETPDGMAEELASKAGPGIVFETGLPGNLTAFTDALYQREDVDAVLVFPLRAFENPSSIYLGYKTPPSLESRSGISSAVEQVLEKRKLAFFDIPQSTFDEIRKRIDMPIRKLKESGSLQSDDSLLRTALGLGSGFLIYMFIFLYGVMVMRGVLEEKTSRIVEIIISSVKPFQLMMGKILGIALVGLTQFVIWALLSGLAMAIVGGIMAPDALEQARQGSLQTQAEVGGINTGEVLGMIAGINWFVILGSFVFFFLGGYLLYSSLLAAIGAAVDAETDTQQFMLPVSLPLAFSLVISMNIIKNPDGPWATFFSIFPLTSPIVMMSRIAFNPPAWQVALSMGLLVVTFVLSTWMAGRIYRTGILMYGKKASYRELVKWLFYKGNA